MCAILLQYKDWSVQQLCHSLTLFEQLQLYVPKWHVPILCQESATTPQLFGPEWHKLCLMSFKTFGNDPAEGLLLMSKKYLTHGCYYCFRWYSSYLVRHSWGILWVIPGCQLSASMWISGSMRRVKTNPEADPTKATCTSYLRSRTLRKYLPEHSTHLVSLSSYSRLCRTGGIRRRTYFFTVTHREKEDDLFWRLLIAARAWVRGESKVVFYAMCWAKNIKMSTHFGGEVVGSIARASRKNCKRKRLQVWIKGETSLKWKAWADDYHYLLFKAILENKLLLLDLSNINTDNTYLQWLTSHTLVLVSCLVFLTQFCSTASGH